MKKLSVNDLHKSLKGSLGNEFTMNELDFANELSSNKDYRDFVFNQIIPAIDSEFTPDLAREIEADLKKKDSQNASTFGVGESVETTSLDVDPPNKKKLAQYYSWQNQPYFGARTPKQYITRKNKLSSLEEELSIFETGFINSIPPSEFGVIDVWENTFGDKYLGEFYDSPTSRDDMIARGVMEQKAINKGLSFLSLYERSQYPDGIPNIVQQGVALSRAVNNRAYKIDMHTRITDYLQGSSSESVESLLKDANVKDQEGLNAFYEQNAAELAEMDDMFAIEIAQPLPEVDLRKDYDDVSQIDAPAPIGFSGDISTALEKLNEITSTDEYKEYMKIEQSRQYFLGKLDEMSVNYPEYAEKIAQDMVLQARTDAQGKALDEASVVYKMPLRGAKVVSRTVLTLLHGIFELPKSIQTMMGGVTNDETDAFLDFFDPDNNTFTRQASYAKRRQFEYLLDLGNGYTAVYDATLEDDGSLQYIVDSSGYMVHDPMKMKGLSDMAQDKIDNGAEVVYDYNTTALATQSAQALVDVFALVAGGEVAAMSKGVTAATTQGLKVSNFVRGGLALTRKPVTAATAAARARQIGSTATMYLQIHHSLYEQSIMNGMSAREAEYYSMGASAAIALVNRLNPEASFVREAVQIGKKELFTLQRGLTNRDMFGIGFKNILRTAPVRAALEGVEERYLEPMGEKFVGDAMKYFNPNLQTINPDWANIFSLKDMDEFIVGAIVGGQMNITSGIKQFSSLPRVHQELMYYAYQNREKTFTTLRGSVGMEFMDINGDTRPTTEEDIEQTIQSLERDFQELDEYIKEAELENKAFFTEEQKMEILQRIQGKNSVPEGFEDNQVLQNANEAFLDAAKKDPSIIDASFTSPFIDAYEEAKRNTNLKELDIEVNTLLGNRNPNADPKHITALAKVLEGNFKNVPVFVDKSAFRAFMVGIGVDEQTLDNYRGVYDSTGKTIFINPDTATLGTPIHEYSHIWVNYVADNNPELFNKMKQLVESSPELMAAVGNDPVYKGKEAVEAMVIAIEKRAEEVVSDPDLLAKLKDAVKEFFAYLAKVFNVRTEDFASMTLQEFVDTGAYEVLTGDFRVGGTIETLPAQSTTMNSNIGNMVSVLSTEGRVQGMLLKNQKGEFYVDTPVGNVIVGQPTDATRAIGDLGVLLAESESRVKIVNGINDSQRTERLIEIDGRLHLVVDDDLMRDAQGNAYGLTLQDKETGQEMFFSVDNEITQEIMRKSINAAYFSKVPETDVFQIGIAPFKNRPVSSQEEFDEAINSPQYQFFEKTLNDVSSELDIQTTDSFQALGGYEFENGQYVNEVSRVMQMTGSREDIELLSAVMGILAPEQQEAVMMLEVGDRIENLDPNADPEIWSDTYASRSLFMLDLLRRDFASTTGISGKTLLEEEEAFEEKYEYLPYYLDVTEDGVFTISLSMPVQSMLEKLRKDEVSLGGYPFVLKTQLDSVFDGGFDVAAQDATIDNESLEMLILLNSAFSRIYNMGLPARFEFNFGSKYTAANAINDGTNADQRLDPEEESMVKQDAFTKVVELKAVLEYIAKRTIGTKFEISSVLSRSLEAMRDGDGQRFGANAKIEFNQQKYDGDFGQVRNFDQPLGLIVQLTSTELEGQDKVQYITDFAKAIGVKGYSFDPNTNRLHIFVNNNYNAYEVISNMEGRWDVEEISYARVKPRFKSQSSTRQSDQIRSRVERGYYETIKAYRSKRPNLADERPNLHNALSIAEEAFVRDEAHRSDNRAMINAPIKIEWNDAKSDYMIGGMTMQQYGFRYGLTNFGGVRPRVPINIGGGVNWEIPGGIGMDDTFTYAELIWMKEQGWNPNDIKDDFVRTALYRKLARTHTQEGINRDLEIPEGMTQEEYLLENPRAAKEIVSVDPVDTFNRYIFGMLSPNQPLTPNEMQVAAMRVQGMKDPDSDTAIAKWFGGDLVTPLSSMDGLPGMLYSEGYTYTLQSVSMGRVGSRNIKYNYLIRHHISDGTIHTHKYEHKTATNITGLFVDAQGNRAVDQASLEDYILMSNEASKTFPEGSPIAQWEEGANRMWEEVQEGMQLHLATSTMQRTDEQDVKEAEFRQFVNDNPWVDDLILPIYNDLASLAEEQGVSVYLLDATTRLRIVSQGIEEIESTFKRHAVVSQYMEGFSIDVREEATRMYERFLDEGVEFAAKNQQSRLNDKAVDPIFREDAGIVRPRLLMGTANISNTKNEEGTLKDGTKIGPKTRIFFHGTRFLFNKLERVEKAAGAGTPEWNTYMKPTSGFTPFVTPSYFMASSFKGIGGEILSISIDADTKVFDPARMGNIFGDPIRDNIANFSTHGLAEVLMKDVKSLARGEKTSYPLDVVGAAMIVAYTRSNSLDAFYQRYFPDYWQDVNPNDNRFVDFGFEEGVRTTFINENFFDRISQDEKLLRKLASDLLYEEYTSNEFDYAISSVFNNNTPDFQYQKTGYNEDVRPTPFMGMMVDSLTLPDLIFAKKVYEYAMDNLEPDFKELMQRYESRSWRFSENARLTNYTIYGSDEKARNYLGSDADFDNITPIFEVVHMLFRFAENSFRLTEQPAIVDFFQEKGYDAFIVRENSSSVANLAVINPDKVNLKYGRRAPGVPRLRETFTAQDVEKVTIQGLANMYPKDPSEPLTAEERKELTAKMKTFFNMQKMDEGGLGLAGSADITNIARFAKMYMMNPDFFMKKKTETWVNFLERVQNQVPGLSSKTGAFSIVWQDPGTAAISAMDRHMFRIFEKELFSDPEVKARFDEMLLTKWNSQVEAAENAKDKAAHYKKKSVSVKEGAKRADNIDDVMAQYKFGNVNAMFMETAFALMGATNVKYRYADGQVNPSISFNLKKTKFVVEPKTVQSISENYMRMLAINEEKARQAGLSVFMSQWALWDKARNRFEPHAMMFPGLHKLPRMSFTNLKRARAGHRDAGYMNSSSISKFNEQLGEITKQMNPVKKAEPGSLLYFSADDPYRNIDMKQAKEIVGKYRRKGMSSDAIREAFIRGGMDRSVADALISVEFNPKDATIPEKVRLGFKNFAGNISQRTTDEIAEDSKRYLPRSNKITSADAYLMLEKMGLEQVYELLMNPTAMKDKRMQINGVDFTDSEVRVVLTRLVAENFDKIANQMVVAGEPELEQQYRMYAANVLDNLLPELTQKGRFIQAASILAKSSGNYYISHINNRLRQQGMEPLSTDDAETLRRLHAKMKNAPAGLPTIEAETELMRFLSEVLPVSLYEVLENQYYSGLLSGYGTNLKNIFGSLNQIMFEGLTEAVASGSIKDFGAFWVGVGKGMVPALNIFRYIMATGVQYGFGNNAPGTTTGKYSDGKRTQPLPIYEYMSPNQFTGDNKFTSKYTGFWGNISTGIGRAMLTIFNPAIMKYFGRTLIGTDVAFSTLGQAAQVELIKARMKREHKFADGMSPSKRAKKVAAMVMGVDKNREKRYEGYAKRAEKEGFKRGTPRHRIRVFELARAQELTEGMRQRMARKGQEYTYNYEPEGMLGFGYSALISALQRAQMSNSTLGYTAQAAKAVFVPFARILVNVANRGYAYSPLGFLKQSAGITTKLVGEGARKMESGSFKWTEVNDYEKSLARARATIGTMITMAIYGLTMGNDDDEDDMPWMTITGAGPSDYSKRYQLSMNKQYKPFTITINRDMKGDVIPRSERKSYEYRDSMVFLTLAAIGTIRDHERFGNPDSESETNRALATATTYGVSFLAAMGEQTYVKGLADLFREVQPSGFAAAEKDLTSSTEEMGKMMEKYITTNAQNLLIPNIVRQITRTGRGLSNRAIQQKVGSMENFDGYFKDLTRDMHMIEPDFPIVDVFGRPVVPTYDNYLPVIVQPRDEERGVHLFFRENFLDKNIFVPKHKFPEYINERGEGVPMTVEEEFMYFALRGAFIYDGLDELRFDPQFDEAVQPNVEALEDEYPFADAEKLETLSATEGKKNMKAELSRIVSEANEKAERYVEAVKFDLPLPEGFELPVYIETAPYAKELFKLR